MYTLLMVLFIILCFFLALFILIQQGKGDLGLGSMGGSQMLFGGSGGQGFFEKATWIMGALFMLGALGLGILKSKEHRASVLEGFSTPIQRAPGKVQHQPSNPIAPITPLDVAQTNKVATNESSAATAPTAPASSSQQDKPTTM